MNKFKKFAKVVCLFLVLAVVFLTAGCKENEKPEQEQGKVAAEEANRTLKIHCYTYESLNPLTEQNEVNTQMLRLIFESLIVCDQTQKAQCVLADNYAVSPDGTVWTVNIKSGIKWHDGSDFTAYDVEKTYKDVLSYKEQSPYYALLTNLSDVYAGSDTEVNFKLEQPQVNFINLLDVPIVKYHSGEKFQPVGTGPYKYTEVKEKNIHLAANDSWHGGKTSIKNVEVKILPDKDTAVYAYVSKEIDIVSVTSSKDWSEYSSNSDNVIVDYPSNTFNYICINPAAEPLSNRLLRMAVAHSVDKEKICSEVLLSHGTVADSCMNRSWWVYNSGVTNYGYEPKKASDTVEELKKNMKIPTIHLMVNSESEDKCRVAEMIKDNLQESGINIAIDYVDWAAFTDNVNSGNYQMYIGTVKYAGDINPAYIVKNSDEKLAGLFEQLKMLSDEKAIKEKYFEIQDKIAQDINIIPLYFDNGSVMYNKRIEGDFKPFRTYIYNGIESLKLGS